MLKVTLSQQIQRLVETGIKNLNSHYVSADIEAIETGIENLNSYFIEADVEAC